MASWRTGICVYIHFSEIVRSVVLIFLILGGALLLNRDIELSYFLKHSDKNHFSLCILFYSFIFPVTFYGYGFFSYNILLEVCIFGWFLVFICLFLLLISSFSMILYEKLNICSFYSGSYFYQFVLFYNIDK